MAEAEAGTYKVLKEAIRQRMSDGRVSVPGVGDFIHLSGPAAAHFLAEGLVDGPHSGKKPSAPRLIDGAGQIEPVPTEKPSRRTSDRRKVAE